MAIDGRVPALALVVELTAAYFHCAKCIIRSKLWSEISVTPGHDSDEMLLAQTMVKHGDLAISVDEMQQIILDDEDHRLY